MRLFKTCFLFFLGIWGILGFLEPSRFGILSGANLLFHEAGHVFFGFLGQTIGIWGGTLMQLLMPLGIAVGFLQKRQIYSAMVMLFWCGQNMIDISIYIKDTRVKALHYVGGEIHDWEYILGRSDLLAHDLTIGNIVAVTGLLMMMAAVLVGNFSLWSSSQSEA